MNIASAYNRYCAGVGHPRTPTRGGSAAALPLALSGRVHPSRQWRTQWHLGTTVNQELFSVSLAQFAKQVDAGPQRELVLVLDGAGWLSGLRITLPAHLHLVSLPPYSPDLQPAERLWTYSNTPLVNAHFADLDALEVAQLARCAALQTARKAPAHRGAPGRHPLSLVAS